MAALQRNTADSRPAPTRGCPGLAELLCLVDCPSGSADTRPPAAAFVPNGVCLELSHSQAFWFDCVGLGPLGRDACCWVRSDCLLVRAEGPVLTVVSGNQLGLNWGGDG